MFSRRRAISFLKPSLVSDQFNLQRSPKLRIAVFTNKFPHYVSTFLSHDIRALLDAGCDVDLFPFYPLDSKLWRYVPDILNDTVLPRAKIHHVGLIESLASLRPWPVRKVGRFVRDALVVSASATRFGVMPFAKSLYVIPKAWAWERLYSNSYDHILAYWGNYAATCAYLFHRLENRRVPFSIFLHAGIDLYADQVYLPQKLLYADNIIVVCDYNRRFIQKLYPDLYPVISHKIIKYHLGLDLSGFPYHPNERLPDKILAVGGLYKYKGYEFLLRAMHELTCRGVDYNLELVGDGTEGHALKQLARKLAISDKVRFSGWLQPKEVRAAMQQATVFVHPSYGIGDAVPTVIKECMALGTPVIASDMVGIPELLDEGRCGILVPPGNPRELANAIETLLKSSTLRLRYADVARRYAESTFDLRRNGRQLANLINSTTRDNTRRGGHLLNLNSRDNNEAAST